jgi:AcrR family transcriptional regulator
MDVVVSEKTPRTERGRRTLRKLLEAAAKEFGTNGYHDAAITGITQRAGVALGTFYTYFDSKEEVFRALVRDMSRTTRLHVAEAVKGSPDGFPPSAPAWPPSSASPQESRALPHHRGSAVRRAGRVPGALLSFVEGYRRNLAAARARGRSARDPMSCGHGS